MTGEVLILQSGITVVTISVKIFLSLLGTKLLFCYYYLKCIYALEYLLLGNMKKPKNHNLKTKQNINWFKLSTILLHHFTTDKEIE